jgi:hypothetical protein
LNQFEEAVRAQGVQVALAPGEDAQEGEEDGVDRNGPSSVWAQDHAGTRPQDP